MIDEAGTAHIVTGTCLPEGGVRGDQLSPYFISKGLGGGGGLREWSLITGRGGYKTGGGGGHVKFYPYEKGGQKKF